MNGNQEYQHDEQVSWADPNNTSLPSHDMNNTIDHSATTTGGDEGFLTQPYSTLDEPVRETIMRDVRSVASKIQVVLLPLKKAVRSWLEMEKTKNFNFIIGF